MRSIAGEIRNGGQSRGRLEQRSRLSESTLADKYDLGKQRALMTGTQAVVRLLLMQRRSIAAPALTQPSGHGLSRLAARRRRRANARAKPYFDNNDILFMPASMRSGRDAIWGAQQAEIRGEGKYDGCSRFGTARAGRRSQRRRAPPRQSRGSSRFGGALALMGDDHTAESSTTAHQSDFHFVDVMMPILSPAGVQEILDYGLQGYALSRYAGVWVGLKCLKDTVESTASVDASLGRVTIVTPAIFSCRWAG